MFCRFEFVSTPVGDDTSSSLSDKTIKVRPVTEGSSGGASGGPAILLTMYIGYITGYVVVWMAMRTKRLTAVFQFLQICEQHEMKW